jgi:hypothetical protein
VDAQQTDSSSRFRRLYKTALLKDLEICFCTQVCRASPSASSPGFPLKQSNCNDKPSENLKGTAHTENPKRSNDTSKSLCPSGTCTLKRHTAEATNRRKEWCKAITYVASGLEPVTSSRSAAPLPLYIWVSADDCAIIHANCSTHSVF